MTAALSSPAPPISGVHRRDNLLLTPRGSDISNACLVCAKASVGGPIVRRLPAARWMTRRATGGGGTLLLVWDVIAFILSLVGFIVDYPVRRKRIVKIGFCDFHRRRYFGFRRGGLAAALLVPVLIAIGIFVHHMPSWLTPILIAAGVASVMGAIFLPMQAPKLELVSETSEGMWVKGAGKPFLELYPSLPAPPHVPQKP